MLAYSFIDDRFNGIKSILRSKETFKVMLVSGFLGISASTLLLTIGTMGTNPEVSGVVFRSYVMIAAVLTPFFLKQKVSKSQLLAILVGFAGVYVLATGGTLISINAEQMPYLFMTLVAALALAVSILLVKKHNASTSGFMLLANLISFAFSILLILLFHVNISIAMPLNSLFSVLFIGIVENALGSVVFYYCYKVFTTSFMGNALLTIPFLVIVMSFLILGTPIKAYCLVAALLLAAGIFMQERISSTKVPERIKSGTSLRNTVMFDVTSAFADGQGEMSQKIKGEGRALAIRIEGSTYDETVHQGAFLNRDCIAFTNKYPHKDVSREEVDFINETLGLEGDDTLLIGVGRPDELEEAFEELLEKKGVKAGKDPSSDGFTKNQFNSNKIKKNTRYKYQQSLITYHGIRDGSQEPWRQLILF